MRGAFSVARQGLNPDHRVVVQGRSIQVQGKARSVEELLRRLEADPLVTEVRIVGAVKASKDPLFEILNLSLTLK